MINKCGLDAGEQILHDEELLIGSIIVIAGDTVSYLEVGTAGGYVHIVLVHVTVAVVHIGITFVGVTHRGTAVKEQGVGLQGQGKLQDTAVLLMGNLGSRGKLGKIVNLVGICIGGENTLVGAAFQGIGEQSGINKAAESIGRTGLNGAGALLGLGLGGHVEHEVRYNLVGLSVVIGIVGSFNEFALTGCCHKHCSTHKSHCDNFFHKNYCFWLLI